MDRRRARCRRLRRRLVARVGRADGGRRRLPHRPPRRPAVRHRPAGARRRAHVAARPGHRRRQVARRHAHHQPTPNADRLAHHRGARRRPAAAPRRAAARTQPLDRGGVPAADGAPRRRRGRAGAHRQVRPAGADAQGDRADRDADPVGAPASGGAGAVAGRLRQGPRRADLGRLAGRRRRLPRPARVRARRRPPPHPLDVDGAHGDADGPPLRRQPPAQPHGGRRHRDRLVSVGAPVRHGHRDRRLARRVVDGQRSARRHLARRRRGDGQVPPRHAQRLARSSHARRGCGRHRHHRQCVARPAHGDRHVGPRRRHRQRPDRALPAHGQRGPPLDARRAGPGVAGRRPAPWRAARCQGRRRRRPRSLPRAAWARVS